MAKVLNQSIPPEDLAAFGSLTTITPDLAPGKNRVRKKRSSTAPTRKKKLTPLQIAAQAAAEKIARKQFHDPKSFEALAFIVRNRAEILKGYFNPEYWEKQKLESTWHETAIPTCTPDDTNLDPVWTDPLNKPSKCTYTNATIDGTEPRYLGHTAFGRYIDDEQCARCHLVTLNNPITRETQDPTFVTYDGNLVVNTDLYDCRTFYSVCLKFYAGDDGLEAANPLAAIATKSRRLFWRWQKPGAPEKPHAWTMRRPLVLSAYTNLTRFGTTPMKKLMLKFAPSAAMGRYSAQNHSVSVVASPVPTVWQLKAPRFIIVGSINFGPAAGFEKPIYWDEKLDYFHIPMLDGYDHGRAQGVSWDGWTIVGWSIRNSDGQTHLWRWTKATGTQPMGNPNRTYAFISGNGAAYIIADENWLELYDWKPGEGETLLPIQYGSNPVLSYDGATIAASYFPPGAQWYHTLLYNTDGVNYDLGQSQASGGNKDLTALWGWTFNYSFQSILAHWTEPTGWHNLASFNVVYGITETGEWGYSSEWFRIDLDSAGYRSWRYSEAAGFVELGTPEDRYFFLATCICPNALVIAGYSNQNSLNPDGSNVDTGFIWQHTKTLKALPIAFSRLAAPPDALEVIPIAMSAVPIDASGEPDPPAPPVPIPIRRMDKKPPDNQEQAPSHVTVTGPLYGNAATGAIDVIGTFKTSNGKTYVSADPSQEVGKPYIPTPENDCFAAAKEAWDNLSTPKSHTWAEYWALARLVAGCVL